MNKIVSFFRNEHIQIALGTGACILILALFFKKIMHTSVPALESALPGLALAFYEMLRGKRKKPLPFWLRSWFWILIMLAIVAVIILRRLYLM